MARIVSPRLYYPKSAVMWQRYATVIAGGALNPAHDALQDFAHCYDQFPTPDGSTFTHPFFLAAGVYTLKALGTTGDNHGLIDWYIDNIKVVSLQDWYAAALTYNVVKTAAVTVVGNGQHTLKGVVNGKNVASTAYYIYLTSLSLV